MPPSRSCQLEDFRRWIEINLPDERQSAEVRQRRFPF